VEEERKMEETRLAEETALARVEHEKAKCMVAMEAVETSRKIAELEARKRMSVGSGYKTADIFSHSPARYRKYTIEEIEEATNFFSNSLKVGEGGYGPVYRCELDHTPVAVKVLKPGAAQGQLQFQQEVWKTRPETCT